MAVTDPRLLFDESGRSDVSEEDCKYGYSTPIGDRSRTPSCYATQRRSDHAAEIRAPLLLAFGAEDRRVPLLHGTLMRDALRAQGSDPNGSSTTAKAMAG